VVYWFLCLHVVLRKDWWVFSLLEKFMFVLFMIITIRKNKDKY